MEGGKAKWNHVTPQPAPLTVHQPEPSGAKESSWRMGSLCLQEILLFNKETEHLLALILLQTSKCALLQHTENRMGTRLHGAEDQCPGHCGRPPTVSASPVPIPLCPTLPPAPFPPRVPSHLPLPTPGLNTTSLPSWLGGWKCRLPGI